MKIDAKQIEDLRNLQITEVAKELGLKVDRGRVLCPWHADKHPSLKLYNRDGKSGCYCYSCSAHSDVIGFVQKVLGVDFRKACEWLAGGADKIREAAREEPVSVVRPFDGERYGRLLEHPVLNIQAKAWLYGERRYSREWIEWLGLNSYREWLQIPYWAQDGRTLIGLENRYLGSKPEQPRFKIVPGSRCNTYNLPILNYVRKDDELWLAEGPSDTWAHLSAGHKCLGIASATLLRVDELRPLAGHRVRFAPDNDAAGHNLQRQLEAAAVKIGFDLVIEALPAGCKDYSDYWMKINNESL